MGFPHHSTSILVHLRVPGLFMFQLESLMMIMAYCRKQGTGVLATACIESEFDPSLMVSKLLDLSRSTILTCSSGIIHHFYCWSSGWSRHVATLCGSDGLDFHFWGDGL